MKTLLLFFIRLYRKLISPFLGPHCRFEPSCSRYAAEAVVQKGIIIGISMAIWRVLRCHPLSAGGYDPVGQ